MSPEGREMFPNDGTSAIGLAQGSLFGFSQFQTGKTGGWRLYKQGPL